MTETLSRYEFTGLNPELRHVEGQIHKLEDEVRRLQNELNDRKYDAKRTEAEVNSLQYAQQREADSLEWRFSMLELFLFTYACITTFTILLIVAAVAAHHH